MLSGLRELDAGLVVRGSMSWVVAQLDELGCCGWSWVVWLELGCLVGAGLHALDAEWSALVVYTN